MCGSTSVLVVMRDPGDNLERVQLVFAEVGSLGSLPQLDHTGLPELCRAKHRGAKWSHQPFRETLQSPPNTHAPRGESWQMLSLRDTIAAATANQSHTHTLSHTH